MSAPMGDFVKVEWGHEEEEEQPPLNLSKTQRLDRGGADGRGRR